MHLASRCTYLFNLDTGRVAVTDIGFPGAHMEPIHSLQQELGRRMKNAGIQVLDGIDATNSPMLQQLMPNASVVIWGSPHCNHFGKMEVCQHLAPGENNTSFKLAAFQHLCKVSPNATVMVFVPAYYNIEGAMETSLPNTDGIQYEPLATLASGDVQRLCATNDVRVLSTVKVPEPMHVVQTLKEIGGNILFLGEYAMTLSYSIQMAQWDLQ